MLTQKQNSAIQDVCHHQPLKRQSSPRASLYFRRPHGSIAAQGDQYISDLWKSWEVSRFQLGRHYCRQQIPSMNLYSRAACFTAMPWTGNAAGVRCKGHSTPPERSAGSSWSKLGTKVFHVLVFPLQSNPTGSETAQCSPRAPRGGLSEELGTACSDLGTKLRFKLPRSCLLATTLTKLVLPTLQLYSFVTFAPGLVQKELQTPEQILSMEEKRCLLHFQQTNLITLLSESCQTQGAGSFPSETLCTGCSSLSCMLGKRFGSLPSHFSFFKKMELACSMDCCSSQNQQCLWLWF